MLKPLCGSQQTGKFLKRWKYQITLPASWETCMQVKIQQLELDMEQQTGSKILGLDVLASEQVYSHWRKRILFQQASVRTGFQPCTT